MQSASWGIQQASEVHHNAPFTAGPLFFKVPVPVRFLSECLPAGGKKLERHYQRTGDKIESEKSD